jgi:DNA-binding CsgD family transcriptional regulator
MSVVPATMDVVARQVSPLVGRDSELRQLTEVASAAADGSPGVVLVAGDAGVGKSRLIAELADWSTAQGMLVLVGHCVNLPDGGPPYLPFVDALRRVDSALRERLDAQLRGDVTGGATGPLQVYESVVAVLSELAAERPVLLVLEDIHWADRSSQDLLRYVLGRLEDQRILVVLSVRSDDLHRRHPVRGLLAELARHPLVRRVTLDPLSADAIRRLVQSGDSTGALDESEVCDIVSRAEGNAFFAEELMEAAISCGAVGILPEGLLDILTSRLEQLDPDAGAVVGVAAVAGRRVRHEVLAAVTGLPDAALDDALRSAVSGHVLVPEPDMPAYQFRHALLQEAAYGDLLPGERVRLHAAYARELRLRLDQRPNLAAELAHHAESSHDLPLALMASVRAARHARSVHAHSEAQRHLERALEWWPRVADAEELAGESEAELYLAAAEAAMAAGEPQRAVGLLSVVCSRPIAWDVPDGSEPVDGLERRTAIDPAGNDAITPELAAVAFARLGKAQYVSAIFPECLTSAMHAVEIADRLPESPARAEVHATAALAQFLNGDNTLAAKHARIALDDAVRVGSPAIEANALVTLSRVADTTGDPETAATYMTRALEVAEASGDADVELRVLFNLTMSRYDAGDLPGTLRWTSRSAERAAATGMTFSEYAHETRGIDVIARYVSGDWDRSLDRATSGLNHGKAIDRYLLDAFALHVAVGRGLEDVPQRIAAARAAMHPDPEIVAQLAMLIGGCEIDHLTWEGEPEAALVAYDHAVATTARQWGPHFLGRIWLDALALSAIGDLSGAARHRGDSEAVAGLRTRADALVEDARTVARLGTPRGERIGAEAVAWLARAEAEYSRAIGDPDDGPWRAALKSFDYGYTYEVARCRWRLAEALLGSGDPDRSGDAAEHLRLAYAAALELGAAPLRDAVAGLARRAKITLGSGEDSLGPATSTASPLTPREQEVLALLAEGYTNRQLGAALFISEKTASVHVSNILAKLAAGTRGEAVAVARKRSLV